MQNFNRALAELQEFCAKNDVRQTVRLSIVLCNEQEKAYFLKGLREELKPLEFDHAMVDRALDGDDFKIYGIEIRVLA